MKNHQSLNIFNFDILFHALEITALVFVMMIIIDWIDVHTRGRLPSWISGHPFYQYGMASLLGLTPGCMGVYMNISLYMHGYISLGAMVGGMIATTGEATLVMFALFPKTALLLNLILVTLGIIFALITDVIVRKFHIPHCEECEALVYHKNESSISHYIKEHVWQHIIKKHIWKIFLWSFFAMWIIHVGGQYWDIKTFVKVHPQLVLLIAVLVGIIPDVAPQFIFVFMFSESLIPFSVLLASSMVQNGHGLIPLLSYSVKDTITIKTFNVIFGLATGLAVMALGF